MADLTRIQQAVQSVAASSGAHNLNAKLNGNMVEIHGTVRSLAEKQNVMRAITEKVGDTGGVINMIEVSSDMREFSPQIGRGGPALGVTHATETGSAGRTHVVKKGETLSHIAQHYYGKASEYQKIFDANRDKLNDPDKIREGVELKIPS